MNLKIILIFYVQNEIYFKKKKKDFIITSTKLMDLAQTKGQEYIMNMCKILRPNEITNDIAQELSSNIRF